jgi:signal transduction histidine kinase
MTGASPNDPTQDALPTPGKPYALVVLLQVHWFIRLRWVFAAMGLTVLAAEKTLMPDVQRPPEIWMVVVGVAAVNVIWTCLSRMLREHLENPEGRQRLVIRSGQLFVSAQIGTDLLLLTWILALTGGVENPMALFYLFHIAISGLLLRTWQALIQSCWAVALYAAMCIGQLRGWIPYYPFLPQFGPAGQHAEAEYVGIAVAVVAFAVFGTLYFTDRIGKVLNRREAMLIEYNLALRKSQQAIQDLQRRRSRFMQTAAHQLKSPLAMVQTFANLIRDGLITDMDGIRTTCDKIVRRAREGIGQVSELLALARVQEASPERHRGSNADVGAIVTEICEKQAPVATEKNLALDWQVPGEGEMIVQVHPTDLTDCASNLVENAIKYTPEGGRVRVTVLKGQRIVARSDPLRPEADPNRARRVEDYIYLIVKDSGIGISDKTVNMRGDVTGDSIFDAFRRGNAALAAGIPGTGLGLSIVREVVEQARGFIQVYSCPGQGSIFTVAFPAQPDGLTATVRDTRSSHVVIETDPDAVAFTGDADQPVEPVQQKAPGAHG